MKNIPLHIINNETGKAFDCSIIEGDKGWQCVLNQQFFCYQVINESPLMHCIDTLAHYLAPLSNVTICGENPSDAMYVAIIDSKIRLERTNMLLNKRKLN